MTKMARKEPVAAKKIFSQLRLPDLQDSYQFWNGDGTPPDSATKIIPVLRERMMNEVVVRRRLKSLSKKLIDILKFFLRSESYSSNMQHIITSQVFSYMNQYEIEAALNALQKRGFVCAARGRLISEFGRKAYLIPGELGETLQNFLWDEEKEAYDTFSLMGYLEKFETADMKTMASAFLAEPPRTIDSTEDAVARLAEPDELRRRIDSVDDEALKGVVHLAITEYGGVMPRTLYDKVRGKKQPPWDRLRWKTLLEDHLLGTTRHLSLGEYGINHFDETLVIYRELVDSYLGGLGDDRNQSLDEIRTLGVDLISDISSFMSFINHNKIRLTLNGSIYKTAVKKIEEDFILSRKEEFEENNIFDFIYSFCLGNRMIQRKENRQIGLTVKGKSWDHQPLKKKLSSILSFAFDEWEPGDDQFHMPRLKKMFIENIKQLDINRWYDVMHIPFMTRNAYLADLDRNNIRDAFQNCYQYNRNTRMMDIQQMANALFQWMRSRFFLLGLVDMGYHGGKVNTMLLNPLGAKALGIDMPDKSALKQKPLIVNPDFEIILFQDGDNYDLITRMDRFAERTKSDNAYHYKITVSTVEKAVAEGMTVSDILTLLSENSRVGIPQNVIYSIREWAEKVKFARIREATLLRVRNKEVIDRILQAGSLKEIVLERIAPTVLMIKPDCDRKALSDILEAKGIFLEKGDRPDEETNGRRS